jgi:hypothetical protein
MVRLPAVGSLTVSLRPHLVADKAKALAAMADGAPCMIDALAPPVFSGEVAGLRAASPRAVFDT